MQQGNVYRNEVCWRSPFSIRRKNEVCDVMQFREFRGAVLRVEKVYA